MLLPSSYPPVLGGLQTATHTLATNLIARGHQVLTVTNRYPRSLNACEVLDGVPVQRLLLLHPRLRHLQARRPDLFAAGFYYLPATLFGLEQLMRTFQPDIINVHYPDNQTLFVLWLRRRYSFRLVVSLHGYEVEGFSAASTWDRLLLRELLRKADAVTACSQYLLDRAIKIEPSVGSKGRTIHNGIDSSRFQGLTSNEYPHPYVLAYGRLTFQKGFDLLLEAFARVVPGYPETHLIIAGEGEERTCLEKLTGRLGTGGRVHFYGRATADQVVELLGGCEFVVMPSRYEAFGIVALEAMAAGKAVLATRVGGLPEFLDDSINRLVEPSVQGLTEGLCAWLGRRAEIKTRGHDNRKLASNHTWTQAVDRYLAVYQG